MSQARVLIVDDEQAARIGLSEIVAAWGYETKTAGDGIEALAIASEFQPSAVITDVIMPRLDGFGLLARLRDESPGTSVILLTGQGNVEDAVRAVKEEGAFYYLEKPVNTRQLQLVLQRAVEQAATSLENLRLRRQLSEYGVFGRMVGNSQAMRRIYSVIEQVASSSASVLITGDSGTGKEVVAATIHQLSPRASRPFVAINCSAIPESLMESELFGHERGAFTGAIMRREGCFELANSGTLFLDEIAEMPVMLQAKLLRVLEERRVRRLGAAREIPVDVRVLAATNKDPHQAVARGELREDLLYRLNVIHITLPPLRERGEDIPLLAQSFVDELRERHARTARLIDPEVLDLFSRYPWPGNVRELRNVVEHAIVVCDGTRIERRHLPPFLDAPSAEASEEVITLPVGTPLDEAERRLILRTLIKTGNNKTRAAEILQISLKTLHNKLKVYRENQLD
ncbi:MAG: sigma-54-dependent Fis family transcriptional regulator [Acidobacteria bacterium]|nr:sigma-54-dependent Fis family transcriptional regulator [Acidobacteriota bacterium]MCW5967662.1 sigma-54-dependent Fis family transcriptional regulator [Blastocatellales bacterium]